MLTIVFAGKLVEQSKHRDAATVLEEYAQVNSVFPFSHPPSFVNFYWNIAPPIVYMLCVAAVALKPIRV